MRPCISCVSSCQNDMFYAWDKLIHWIQIYQKTSRPVYAATVEMKAYKGHQGNYIS